MDNIKKFIDCFVPVYKCNFKCKYCYIATWENWKKEEFSEKIKYDPKHIRKAFSIDRWGGPLMLNFCAAGETLFCNEIVPIVSELLDEGHYCMIVTNGTMKKKFDELVLLNKNQRDRLFIKFSYHYLELKRLNMLDIFFENVNKMKKAGISYTIELTPYDEYIPYIEEIKETCKQNVGAIPHVTVCRNESGKVPIMSSLSKEDYEKTWSQFDSKLFDYKMEIFNVKRKEFCYAGSWSYVLNLVDGELRQCYRGKVLQNIFDDIDSPIKEEPIGCNCIDAHCWNGHAFLAFGVIPTLKTPTFAEERNRNTEDGPWVTEKMNNFMETKLYNSNKEYSDEEKKVFNKKSKITKHKYKLKENLRKIIKNK